MYTALESNLKLLHQYSEFQFIKHDIRHPIDISCDAIYHLACPASPPHYQKDPLYTLQTCVNGIVNVLELAHQKKIPVLYTSTSEVYGDPIIHPQPESYR